MRNLLTRRRRFSLSGFASLFIYVSLRLSSQSLWRWGFVSSLHVFTISHKSFHMFILRRVRKTLQLALSFDLQNEHVIRNHE